MRAIAASVARCTPSGIRGRKNSASRAPRGRQPERVAAAMGIYVTGTVEREAALDELLVGERWT